MLNKFTKLTPKSKMSVLNKYLEVLGIQRVAEYCIAKGEKRILKKNEFFNLQNELCNSLGYIAEGGFRYITTNVSNIEFIVAYTFAEDFVTDYPALQTGNPCMFSGQAISDSVIYVITKEQIDAFYRKPINRELRAMIAETFLADIYSKLIIMHCDTPEERYKKLVKRYPKILNQVALKEIASYINVTPETLSRIRKKIVTSED